MMIKTFKIFYTKTISTFSDSLEKTLLTLQSIQSQSIETFIEIYEQKIISLYALENCLKGKINRQVHKICLCLNSLVKNHYASPKASPREKRSNRDTQTNANMEITNTFFKTMFRQLDQEVLLTMKETPIGSVELLYTKLARKKHELFSFDRQKLVSILRECGNSNYATAIKLMYNSRRRGMRQSNSFFRRELGYRGKNNFLENDSLEMEGIGSEVLVDGADNFGILYDDRVFLDFSYVVLQNFVQMNKIFTGVYIPSLFN